MPVAEFGDFDTATFTVPPRVRRCWSGFSPTEDTCLELTLLVSRDPLCVADRRVVLSSDTKGNRLNRPFYRMATLLKEAAGRPYDALVFIAAVTLVVLRKRPTSRKVVPVR